MELCAGDKVRYFAQSLNCSLMTLSTLVSLDLSAQPTFYGIGFYFKGDGQEGRFVNKKDLLPMDGAAGMLNGKPAWRHEFGAISRCWAGSVSSSLDWRSEFKAYVLMDETGGTVRLWENIDQNHVLDQSRPSF